MVGRRTVDRTANRTLRCMAALVPVPTLCQPVATQPVHFPASETLVSMLTSALSVGLSLSLSLFPLRALKCNAFIKGI